MGQEVRKGLSEAGQEVLKLKTISPIVYQQKAISLFPGEYCKPACQLDYTSLSINISFRLVTIVFEFFMPFIND